MLLLFFILVDYAMSPDTVIVGDGGCHFLHSNGCSRNPSTSEEHSTSAVALVFAVDRNKPPGNFEFTFLVIYYFLYLASI